MRVLFVPGSFRPDRCGVSHYTACLIAELRKQDIEPLIATTRAAAAHHSRPEIVGATAGWGARMLISLPLAIRRLDPDVLHIQHAAGSFAFRRAIFWLPVVLRASGWRKPIAITLHEYGWWQWRPRLGRRVWQRLGPWGETRGWWDREDLAFLTSADVIIATHEATVQTLAGRLPGLAPRIQRIAIGSNIPVLAGASAAARSALRERQTWEPEAPVIVYFGFLHPVKGLETLLRAFRRVLDREPRARLLIVGGAESLALHGDDATRYARQVQALAAQLDLTSAVRLTGYLPEKAVSQCLAGADIGVLPFNDGVTMKSGSLLAMWAHGLPVVATQAAVRPPELEQASWLVPGRNPEALAAALLRLLSDPETRQVLAGRARRAAAAFAWPTIAERHRAIYEAISYRLAAVRQETEA